MERSDYVTLKFAQLQGLRLMPLALLFAMSSAYRAGLYHLPWDDNPVMPGRWFMVGMALAIAASYPIRDLYWYRYGDLTQGAADWQVWPLVVGFACVVAAMMIQDRVTLPFSLPSAVTALLLAVVGLDHYPFRRHYLAAAAVFAAGVLLRPLGVPEAIRSVVFDAAIAAVLTIVGIGDHRLLTTTLANVHGGEVADGEAHAGV